jgi:hypothetical protein
VFGKLRVRRPSPALVLGATALFFAVGGSALAVGQHVGAASRCANGAVKGFAVVTGDPLHGIENIPQTFSSSASLFGPRYNCTGRAVQVRLLPENAGFAVRFAGVTGKVAVASVLSPDPGAASVKPLPDGSIAVTTAGNQSTPPGGTGGQFNRRTNMQFVVVVF